MPAPPDNATPIPLTPLGELKSWRLEVNCSRCRRRVTVLVGDLAEQYGPKTRFGPAIERLRCRSDRAGNRCGGTPERVVLAEVFVRGKTASVRRQIVIRPGRPRW